MPGREKLFGIIAWSQRHIDDGETFRSGAFFDSLHHAGAIATCLARRDIEPTATVFLCWAHGKEIVGRETGGSACCRPTIRDGGTPSHPAAGHACDLLRRRGP